MGHVQQGHFWGMMASGHHAPHVFKLPFTLLSPMQLNSMSSNICLLIPYECTNTMYNILELYLHHVKYDHKYNLGKILHQTGSNIDNYVSAPHRVLVIDDVAMDMVSH